MWDAIQDWFLSLGAEYGVDPLIFGAIYVGAIPFFTLSVGWVVRNLRRGESIVLPALAASFFFVSAYLYLLVAGRNIPWWVYGVLAAMVVVGAWSTVRKVRARAAGESAETPVVLLIADISGYTRFMLDNAVATSHAHAITARLLSALVRAARPPLGVAEIEGDAVFFYATATESTLGLMAAAVKAQVPHLFRAFEAEVLRLVQMDACSCSACASVGGLRLKQVGHVGEATVERVGRFEKLVGPDVILVHRLLKNAVPARRYVLLTGPACRAFSPFFGLSPERHVERVADFGEVEAFVFGDGAVARLVPSGAPVPPLPWHERLRWRLRLRLRARRAASALVPQGEPVP